jgi:hypothetical protein
MNKNKNNYYKQNLNYKNNGDYYKQKHGNASKNKKNNNLNIQTTISNKLIRNG